MSTSMDQNVLQPRLVNGKYCIRGDPEISGKVLYIFL